MRCPTCGHENTDLATRCAACGSELIGSTPHDTPSTLEAPDEAISTDESSASDTEPIARDSDTAKRPIVAERASEPTHADDPKLREVADSAGKFAQAKRRQIVDFFASHQRALGVTLALLVFATLGVTWFMGNLKNTPTFAEIERDMAERIPTFTYAGGTFGPDLEIGISKVSVTEREAVETPSGIEVASGIGPGAYLANVEATYDDGHICAIRNVSATYVRTDEGWSVAGELAEEGTSLTARTGVDEGKVLANINQILEQTTSAGDESVASIFEGGTFEIVGNTFSGTVDLDTATDVIVIACRKDASFYSYSGNVTATFAFESGEWRLRSSEADAQTTKRTYISLEGTWTGSEIDHDAESASCYGAQNSQLTVTIDSIADPSAEHTTVQGTITGLVHAHPRLTSPSMSEKGDLGIEAQAFSGTLSSVYDSLTGSDLTIEGTCDIELPDDHLKTTATTATDTTRAGRASQPRGQTSNGNGTTSRTTTTDDGASSLAKPTLKVTLTIHFGTASDPSAVVCDVVSTYTYEESLLLFIPHETTTTFTDTYQLFHME